jgi:rSAM/selenodomain-associated transferase 1
VHSEIPICIFAKPPVPGEVKTRLIPALGAAGAARLASAMLRDVWHAVESYPGVRPILATTKPGVFPVSVREPDMWLQGEGDLGERIERIIIRGLQESTAVIALGADSPAFSGAHLGAALECLAAHDAVVGPSIDGGFYLLALRRCPSRLFASLPWSTGETRRALKARLREHAFSIAELEPLFDIDTPTDLSALTEYLAAHPYRQSATREWWVESSCASASSFRL